MVILHGRVEVNDHNVIFLDEDTGIHAKGLLQFSAHHPLDQIWQLRNSSLGPYHENDGITIAWIERYPFFDRRPYAVRCAARTSSGTG